MFLISEDTSKHYLKLFDDQGVETPNIMRLANQGLIFNHAYSNSPVCSVARTTLMTGCYAPRIGAHYHRKTKLAPMSTGYKMFPEWLREAGYYTTNRSKKDYNVVESNAVWNESSRKASWENRKPRQPFFHMQTFTMSHEGSLHFNSQQQKNRKTKNPANDASVAPYHPDTDVFRYTHSLFRDRIQLVDREIGKVIDKLERADLLDSTFIFYFGDHGGALPRSKGYLYETGLHVPLVIHVPKNFKDELGIEFSSQKQVRGLVSFVDMGPTVLQLAGVETKADFDGQPFLGSPASTPRDHVFGYADRFDEKYDMVRSLRVGKFKYIRNYQPFNVDGLQNNYRYRMLAYQQWRNLYKAKKLNQIQSAFFETKPVEALFDLQADPHEIKNLAQQPNLQTELVAMRKRMANVLSNISDLGFFPENYFLQNSLNDPMEFGRQQKTRIEKLIEIADYQLLPFETAKQKIESSLDSEDPWQRYWALITCSAFEERATVFTSRIKSISRKDPLPLLRVRAAEFLAITGKEDPAKVISQALQDTTTRTEQAIILNSIALLQDSYGFEFNLKREWFEQRNGKDNVERRLAYLLKSKQPMNK